jgi:hypothetical protein
MSCWTYASISSPRDALVTWVGRVPMIRKWSFLTSLDRGGERGSGSHWIYDGGPLVRKSLLIGKPVILVTCKSVHSFKPYSRRLMMLYSVSGLDCLVSPLAP